MLDPRVQPVNTLELIFGKVQKVGRCLKRHFPKKHDLRAFLVEESSKGERLAKINRDRVKELLADRVKASSEDKLSRRDWAGFYSAFVCNPDGETNFDEMLNLIYEYP